MLQRIGKMFIITLSLMKKNPKGIIDKSYSSEQNLKKLSNFLFHKWRGTPGKTAGRYDKGIVKSV